MKLLPKLLLLFIPLTLIFIGLAVLTSKRSLHVIMTNEVQARGLSQVSGNQQAFIRAFEAGTETALLPLLQTLKERVQGMQAAALHQTGGVLAHTNVLEKGKTYTDALTLRMLSSELPVFRETAVKGEVVLNISVPVLREAEEKEDFLLSAGDKYPKKRLGTIIFEMPLAQTIQLENRLFIRQAIFLVLAACGLSLGLIFFAIYVILKPAQRLAAGIVKVNEGRYGLSVPVRSNDELGQLTAAFNSMVENLGKTTVSRDKLAEEIVERKKVEEEVRWNFDTQRVINSVLSLSLKNGQMDELMQRALDFILETPWLNIEAKGTIFLVEEVPGMLVMKARSGISEVLAGKCAKVPFGRCLCGKAAMTREIQFAGHINELHDVKYEGMQSHGHYCVPIVASGLLYGVLNVYLADGYLRNERDIVFLTTIANTLAGIIMRKQMETELHKSEERFQQVADSSQVWIWETDADGLYTYSSSVVEKVLGYKTEELVGRKYFFDSFAPEIKEVFKKAALEAFGRKDPINGLVNANVRKNGDIIILETNGVPIIDSEGKLLGYRGSDTDITERKRLEATLVQSEKMSAIGQLAAGVAHEINNPLGIILGFAQSVTKKLKEGDSLALPLKTIEREAVRCKNLVQNLLTFSRTQKSEQQELLDLNNPVDSALALVEAKTKTHNIELVREPGAGLPKIRANNTQFQQIIINLANNAIDAMPKGGTLAISTALSRKRPGYVELRVRDTGSGISKELQKKIFEPFFTTKEVGKGTGLGLSLVYEIVHEHGGTVELESEEGKGAEFTVFLPIQLPAAPGAGAS